MGTYFAPRKGRKIAPAQTVSSVATAPGRIARLVSRLAREERGAVGSAPPTKTEGGQKFPKAAYAYTPSDNPSTWKLRLWESPTVKVTAKAVGAAIAALGKGFRGNKVVIPAADVKAVKKTVLAAWSKLNPDANTVPVALKEALPGNRTLQEFRELITDALREKFLGNTAGKYLYVRDMTDEWAVYEMEGAGADTGTYKITFTVADDGTVTFGDPVAVEERTVYELKEATDQFVGHITEAKGTDDSGSRVFGVEILAYGDSKNGRRYTSAVMKKSAHMYEGAKAFDHHRTEQELQSSTITGLVGHYRGVKAGDKALEADLHLLPSATHVAEALDASLAAEAEGLDPIVGISHDVNAMYRPLIDRGKRLMEATEITRVNSADVVAHPAAGGRAVRMVAGGSGELEEGEAMPKFAELIELVSGATDEERQQLADALGVTPPSTATTTTEDGTTTAATTTEPEGGGEKKELATVGAPAVERDSTMGRLLVGAAVKESGLPEKMTESIARHLGERFTETELTRAVETAKAMASDFEKAGLAPTVTQVTKEDRDARAARLDKMFEGDFREGYKSLKDAFVDLTGYDSRKQFSIDSEDFNRLVLRESVGLQAPYDSARSTESVDTTTWAQILGDSITRRLIAEYGLAQLSAWRKLVSSTVPVNDFRTQRLTRMGGYGVLPAVAESGPYQPLSSPPDEEATYAITKRGGTEDLTLETIANDDLRAVIRIPVKLGRAAAQTLFRFVFDLLATNPTIYDAVALFAAGHNNTDTSAALTQTTLSTGRRKMRKQPAYGDASELLGFVPKLLVVPPDLEEIAFQLATSAVAIPSTPAGPSDTPNIHQGIEPIVIDYFSDTNDWFIVADPTMCPTIELGFYQGRQDPELFVQDDPKVGSVFTADKITWKIRHIYSGAVLDYRGFYRGQG